MNYQGIGDRVYAQTDTDFNNKLFGGSFVISITSYFCAIFTATIRKCTACNPINR